jgi:transcription factor Dp-1
MSENQLVGSSSLKRRDDTTGDVPMQDHLSYRTACRPPSEPPPQRPPQMSPPQPPWKVSKTSTTSTPNPVSRTGRDVAPPSGSSSGSNTNKAYKGLRHFSLMVCKKVEQKGTTTYNQVADELVRQILEEQAGPAATTPSTTNKFDEKNIRRRVYDALNVLMAMDIIVKDKKEIFWKGLPSNLSLMSSPYHDNYDMLQREMHFRSSDVQRKRGMIQELLLQHICFRNLVERNYQRELKQQSAARSGVDTTSVAATNSTAPKSATTSSQSLSRSGKSSTQGGGDGHKRDDTAHLLDNKIPLPFIVVNTSSSAVIQCNMSRDLTDVMFDFTMPFEINDDNSILKRLCL